MDVKFDHSVKIANSKILVIDNLQTLTGSYNWTHSAEFKNAENLVFIKSQEVAKKCTEYFEERWKISKTFATTHCVFLFNRHIWVRRLQIKGFKA
jgi:phosphatidylserine/phosphatidylglycerophosphate/cardiolipin synthase-like enzyme